MANHCYNSITLQGSEDAITKLAERLTDTYSKFNYLNGWADYVLGIRDDFEYSFENDERNDSHYYGSRWFDFDLEVTSDTIEMRGDSAWSPLVKFTEELCKVYGLEGSIYYSESGMDFAGEAYYNAEGEVSTIEGTCDMMAYNEDVNYWFESMLGKLDGADEEEIDEAIEEAMGYATAEHLRELKELLTENN
jgi:hypothetical protein